MKFYLKEELKVKLKEGSYCLDDMMPEIIILLKNIIKFLQHGTQYLTNNLVIAITNTF